MVYRILTNRKIIDILIGDKAIKIEEQKRFLPYLSGPNLAGLSSELGFPSSYGNQSRWVYMHDLIEYLVDVEDVDRLFRKLFYLSYFESDITGNTPEEIKETHEKIVESAINEINSILFFSEYELKEINGRFYILSIDDVSTIEIDFKTIINQEYILGLEERVEKDLAKENYDSVLTKCRTILEEVLIYILEERNLEVSAKGNIVKLYNTVKTKLNIQQKKEFDKRVNQLLSGIESIIKSISKMRNITGDAHGKGRNRIVVGKREAELTINSTKTICLYLISISEDQKAAL